MNKKRQLWVLAAVNFVIFFCYAMYCTQWGASTPSIIEYFGISKAQLGLILTVQSVGGLAVAGVLALFGERLNKMAASLVSAGFIALGCVGISAAPALFGQNGYTFVLLCATVVGLGLTGYDVLMNSMIPDVFTGSEREGVLSLVHAFYGIGALAAPVLTTALIGGSPRNFVRVFLLIAAGISLMLPIFAVIAHKLRPQTVYADMSALRTNASQNPAEVFKTGRAWLLFAAALCFLLFQNGANTWLPSYYHDAAGMSEQLSSLTLTAFYAGGIIMRFVSVYMFRKVKPQHYCLAAGIGSALMLLITMYIKNPTVIMILVAIAGFCLGACAVAQMIIAVRVFPGRTASAMSIVVLASNAGALIAPALIGWMTDLMGYKVPMTIIFALLGIVGVLDMAAVKGKKI